MMAPAYTRICSTARNCASSRTNSAAIWNSVTTSHSALATALLRVMHSRALPTAIAAKVQKSTSVTGIGYSPLGSDGSHRVDTGCVCAHSRSRSYTKRSREYSEFS